MAKSLLATLSIGSLVGQLARVAGWSPEAKTLRISAVEGPAAEVFEGLTGTVKSVQETVMMVEPDRTVHSQWTDGSQLRLTARHHGWTPYSLCLKPIAVVLEAVQPDGRPGPVAIGMAAILHKRSSVTRG
jgi:hypothetical protein